MLNKKTIIIIILAVVIFFSSAVLIFFLVKRVGDKAAVNKIDSKIIDELKNNHPEFSDAQLNFYKNTAVKGNTAPCLGRADEDACVSSVAFIKQDVNLCHDLESKNEKLYMECGNGILKKTADAEISQCTPLMGDDYYNCLEAVFTIDNKRLDCLSFPGAETRSTCEDILNYNAAFLSYDRALCKTVKTEKLNQYCLKVIIDKNQDTDGDGLTDLDEINKYKTHYLFADTDNDGINDGEAVKRGLIK
ncbi:MAG: hypothetical protein WCL13_01145 [bacterium]